MLFTTTRYLVGFPVQRYGLKFITVKYQFYISLIYFYKPLYTRFRKNDIKQFLSHLDLY
jgi:hypothetical protein